MEFLSFFQRLKKKGIKLILKNDSLSIKSNGEIDKELLLEIKSNKDLIIQYLEKYQKENNTNEYLEKYNRKSITKELLEKITPCSSEYPLRIPLSFSQERLWFLDQLEGTQAYHIPIIVRLQGSLDIALLDKSLKCIVSRHEVLRTNLLSENGVGYQEIVSEEGWSLDQKMIFEEGLKDSLQEYFKEIFDLSKDYKLRSRLYDLGNDNYVLACVFHHIASDGWSGSILINEFTELYRALNSGREANLPNLDLQYSDYAIWQRKYLQGNFLEKQLLYWKEKLTDVSTLSLPIDYVRPSIQSAEGSTVSLRLNEIVSNSLKSLCQQEGVTLFMVLLSAFKILLSRYSGQNDICVGTPIANRTQSELEGMIGFFVNTLALRTNLSNDLSFRGVLERVKKTTLEGYDHQLVPFEKVVNTVVSTRDISMSPLFQVMFVLQNASTGSNEKKMQLEGITLSEYDFHTVTSQFDLTLNVSESNSGIILNIEYCTALFDKTTISRMLNHYQELLKSIVTDITQSIGSLSMLSRQEETKLLEDFNATEVDYPKEKTIVDLFLEQVSKTPEAIAVVFEGEELSYKELDNRSNQLGHYLQDQGVEPDDLVGICLDRSLEMLIGILGILKSGGAYVPIDPEYPKDRIDYMLDDAGIRLVLSIETSVDVIANREDLSVFMLDRDWSVIKSYPTNRPDSILCSSHLAYVIYTSGSTGKPKGVMNEHGGIVNRLLWTQSAYQLTSLDRVLQKTSFSFDVSVWEFFWPLISGAKLILSKPEGHKDGEYLKDIIEDQNITTIHFVPSMLHVFLESIDLGDCSSLRRVLCSGESLRLDDINLFKEKFTGVRLENLYGPTEAAIDVTFWGVPLEETLTEVLIGMPVSNTSLYILNDQEHLLPIGVVGELCIGGDQVARGYLNKEDLTKEKFKSNPFKEGDRIYKTGDLARWTVDGSIEYIGRKDNQVKIRGYRIELGEIENVLSSLAFINQCCVLAKEDVNGNKRLIGYVVVEGDLDKTKIQEELKESLPDYMVPGIWVELDAMPLTSNGKLDRKSLPDPDTTELSTKEYVAARNEIESQLVEIWQELLGVDRVGIYDNFFELGGHSLLVIQLISRLQASGFHIRVQDVFGSPTIISISDKLSSVSSIYSVPDNGITVTSDHITPSMVPLVNLDQSDLDKIVGSVIGGVSNIQDIYPLSPLQEGIHFHYMMNDKSQGDPYFLPSLLSFSDKEKRNSFIEALQFVVNRHDVLRTCIKSEGLPTPVQVVLREVTLYVEEISLDDSKDILSQLKLLTTSGSQWMDISRAPLLELKSAEDVKNDCYYLIINQHHLILDHVGLEKVISEVTMYLSGDIENLPVPVLYRDFIGHTLYYQSINDSESYFRSLLGGIDEPVYPFELSNTLGDGRGIKESSLLLSGELSRGLREVCTGLGISPAVLFYAAYGLVVGRCSNKRYAIFGSVFSGRLQGSLGAADSLGLFINTLPVLLELKGSVSEYLKEVKKRLEELLPYEQTPLSHIQNWSGISNDIALFSALLNYRHSSSSTNSEDKNTIDLGISVMESHGRTNYPFTLNVDDFGVDFGLTAQVDKSIGSDRILVYMEKVLIQLLEGVRSKEEVKVENLDILVKEEEIKLLEDFNATEVDYPKEKTVVDLFLEQVTKTPDAIAVVFEGEELSYKELDNRSNQLGHYLQDQGVEPDDLVGICLDRSLEMLIGILGILKSGGAYVPIDPEYPKDRIDYMLDDADIRLVLSSSVNREVLKGREDLSIFMLDTDWSVIKSYPANTPESILCPSDLAYVIYTSGSTGRPKGVLITHGNIVSLCTSCDYIVLDSNTIWLSTGSISFDATTLEFWGTLLNGGQLVLADTHTLLDVNSLKKLILNRQVTTMWMTASWFHQLVEEDLSLFASLSYLLVGGDVVLFSYTNKLKECYPKLHLINGYGPTENTTFSTTYYIDKKTHKNLPIGKPIKNSQGYILDSEMNIAPIGVVGELHLGGSGLAKGYLNREDLTKDKFIVNPFKEGDRIYKTGDLARWTVDGNLEFIGRKDAQVKVRGYRIELGEIENALSSLAFINQCCVLAKEDVNGNKRLIGYVVVEGDLDKAKIQEELKGSLPDYMVPGIWVELDAMPLTSNGKLDRKSLPDPDTTELSSKEYVAARNEIELELVKIWQELLGVDRVGIYDNFFELGGHSLLVVQLISRLQRAGFYIGVKDIFGSPTIISISDKLSLVSSVYSVPDNGITVTSDYITPSMVPLVNLDQSDLDKIIGSVIGGVSNIQDIYPLSPLQEGIYFHHMMSDKNHGDPYILPSLLSFSDKEKRNSFIEALQFVVNRHDVLRTCIKSEGLPTPVQVVLREALLSIDSLDLDLSLDILPQLELLIVPGSQWMDISRAPLLELKSADDPNNNCYYLIIYQHHLMVDHVAMEKMITEVTMYLLGKEENLPVPVLYRDFIGHTLHSQSINDSEFYFRSLLGGIDEPAYPFGLSDIQGNGIDIEESKLVLPKALNNQLRNICGKLGISPAVLFHAAYGLVVGRCSNKEQVIFGSLFSGRLQGSLGAADSLGLFINTLPILLELKGSVSEYLKEVKKRLEELLPYEQTPLSHIQNWSGTSNNVALFSALLNYRHTSIPLDSEDENTIDLGISVIESHERTNYPFTLNVDDLGVDFGLTAQVDKSIGSDRVITYMKEILVQLLEELQKESEVSIDNLGILPKEEEIKLLEDFNATEVDYPKEKTIVDLFLEQVSKTPEAIAVVFEGEELSYKELDNRSNQLGHYLQDQGVEPDDLVGICLDRSLEMLIGILGILKSGGAYVPIDPEYPKDRIDYMLDDAGIRLVLSIETSVDVIANREDLSVFMLDRDWSVISDYPTNTPESILCPSHLAYVIYTSGSTGKPKGVLVSHVSLLNFILSMVDRLEMKGIKSFLSVTTFTFDIFYLELFSPLLLGAKVIVLDSNSIRDGDHFISAIADYSPDFMQATPSTWQMLVDHGWDNREGVTILTGGEALKESLKNRLTTISNRVWNLYGPTETTIWVTAQQLDFLSSVTIGMPVSNTSLYILNDQEHLLPIGVVGELCIGGDQVARGYLNKEDLTKEKFIVNPFKEGDRIYKTGDLARWTVDGTIEYIGRKDNQVKIRGYRIELGEIENALSSLAFINQCCVLAKEDVNGNKRLIGYVVVEGDLDKTKIQEELKESLPDYMVPGIWVELDRMPLTSNGKLDRKSLPDPDTTELSSKEYVAARNEIELELVKIWQELLGVDRVGIYDNFFELGGHSLLATRLVSMIRKELNIEIEIADIFEYTTISSLGSHVSVQSEGVLLPSIVIEDRPIRIPLSFSQERLWFLDQLEGTSSYHIPIVIQLEGRLVVSVLEKSLQSIVSRHEVLRTNILSAEGVGYQEVVKSEDWFLDHKYVSDQVLLEESIQSYLMIPFDLSKDYKLRACLYDLGRDNYVLVCVFHHIASDGWSEGILVKEFTELYSAFQSGRVPVLPDLSLQYSDYAIWQRKYLEGEVLENQLSYWEDKLEGVSTLSLPTDYDRPVVQSSAGGSVSLELDKELSDSLNILCREEGVTLFMVLLSGFKVLLSRYSGQEDICVGTPIANRTQSELEGMIGFFVNTLALRSELGGDLSFRELLGQVKTTTLGGYDHQLVPFEKVVDRVITSRDMSRSPLFQVMFVLQNISDMYGESGVSIEDVTISGYDLERVTSQFDLTLNVSENDLGIILNIAYCTALFDKTTIIRMLNHYQELLKSIVTDITQSIGSLSMLSRQEETKLLEDFNATEVDYPKEKTIVDLFLEQVSKTPEAIAVVFEGEELSYKELDNRSNQLGHYLQDQGIEPDDLVGICLDRSLEMLIGILGILKSGGAYVPIDPEYPKDRIDYMLDDAGIRLVLSIETSVDVIANREDLSVFMLDRDWSVISDYPTNRPDSILCSSHLAYVIYTSGSTGKPKGVMNEHGGIVNRLLWTQSAYQLTSLDRVLQKTSFSFDVSVWEFFWPLISGAKLILSKPEGHKDGQYLKDIIEDQNITTIHFVPSMLHVFLESIDLGDCSSLRRVLCSGESLRLDDINLFKEKFKGVRLENLYGPTEAAIDVTFWGVPLEETLTEVLIGMPVSNTSLYILNDQEHLLPIGVVGELCIGGDQVARGYLNKEDLTKEKFKSNPFKEGDRIYKTGDLARWTEDGSIEYIGRKDNQVKIRGYRIELGEIENALSSLAFINQCCVLAKEDVNGNKRLIGYVVVEGDLDKTKIQEELKGSLPDYMVPGIWVELDAMPLTSNGKLDRKSLPDPDTTELSSKEYVAARNEIELELVKIWQELLGVDRVGIYDNFFELGGHSLLATRLVSMIRKELNIEIEIADIFEYTTISSLGSHVSVQSEGVLLPSIVIEDRPIRIPLSFSQERLWFLDQLEGTSSYHIPIVIQLEGRLAVSVLEESLQSIVSRHEVLRTNILSAEGVGYQEVVKSEDWFLDHKYISDQVLLEESIQSYLMIPFDLSKDYKLRACLYDLGRDNYVLVCVFHHIASDGWSEGILVKEFTELYSAFQSGRVPVLPDLSLQYSDYAIWQRKYLEGEVLENQLSYWEDKLEGVSTLSLPTDYDRPVIQSSAGGSVSLELDKELSDSLNILCREEGVTLFMVLLSGFKVLLSRYSGQEDICVGTPIANRTQSELEGMIGFFVNTLALRSELGGDLSFRELLGQVKTTTLGGYDHQLVPFEKVVDRVITSRDMSRSPLFQVMFVLQNISDMYGESGVSIEDVTISGYDLERVTSQFDLTLNVSENDLGIILNIAYCTALFDKTTISRMLNHYQELLKSIVTDITQSIGSLSMLSRQEETKLLEDFNATEVDYPKEKTIVDLFLEQVSKTPEAIAVVFEGEELSYKELDNRSNQLGHYLQDQGVEPDDLVGICLDRSLEMLIGILGILKSGGAYVPIDPEYPKDRIDYMLDDAGIRLVLSIETSVDVIANREDLSVFMLDRDWSVIKSYPTNRPDSILCSSHLAYVIYTSGSTGKPKGVMNEHGGIVNRLLWTQSAYQLTSLDRVLQKTSFSFDVSVWEFFWPLISGAKLILSKPEGHKDGEYLKDIIEDQNITTIHFVPSMLHVFLESIDLGDCSSLRRVLCSGESLRLDDINLFKEKFKGVRLENLYGPTEAAIDVTFWGVPLEETLTEVLIGMPVSNTSLYILNDQEHLLPIGVVGELCIGGDQVARGYLNKEDLTKEKFKSNPFKEGDRIYKTGDLARWTVDGTIEYIGRKDNQVKIRGYRIELGEIENALSSLAFINQCCVLAKEDVNGNKRLIGYVVVEGDLDKTKIQEELKGSLPDYMVPGIWVELDAMPLTSNGKLDRKSLPDPDTTELSSKEYVAARNEIESQLVKIWQELLGVDRVGIYDNFFELGGHSLLATRLVSMIRKELKMEVEIRDIFEFENIEQLANYIRIISLNKIENEEEYITTIKI